MPTPKGNASQESPLFTDEPRIVLDIVRVCQERVERQERKAVKMGVPGDANVEAGPLDLLRANNNRSPVCMLDSSSTEMKETYMTMT